MPKIGQNYKNVNFFGNSREKGMQWQMVELFISFIFMICKNKNHPSVILVMLTNRMYKCRKIILSTNISSHKVNVHPGDHRVYISQVDINLRDKK